MQIQTPLLCFCILLLVPPLPLSAAERKFLKSRRNQATSIRSMLGIWQNWADFARGGVGVYLLTQFAIEINPAVKSAGTKALLLESAILAVGLLLQVVRFRQGVQLIAPVFYLCGLTLVLAGYDAGGFAVFAGWLFAVGIGSLAYQLPIMGVALGAAGYLLDSSLLHLMLACGLIFVPVVLGFLFQQQLLFVARDQPSVPG